jgi:hypothetical protein
MTLRLLGPYLAFAVLKHVIPLQRLARWAWLRPVGSRDREVESRALGCAVHLRQRLGAERGDCLQGSLALYRVLSRAGSDPRLVVGFRRAPSALDGHAWIEIDDACVIESPPAARGFITALAFGRDGLRVASSVAPPANELI